VAPFLNSKLWTLNLTLAELAHGQLQAWAGFAAVVEDGLSDSTVHDLCCPHPCGEYGKGKEEEG